MLTFGKRKGRRVRAGWEIGRAVEAIRRQKAGWRWKQWILTSGEWPWALTGGGGRPMMVRWMRTGSGAEGGVGARWRRGAETERV